MWASFFTFQCRLLKAFHFVVLHTFHYNPVDLIYLVETFIGCCKGPEPVKLCSASRLPCCLLLYTRDRRALDKFTMYSVIYN